MVSLFTFLWQFLSFFFWPSEGKLIVGPSSHSRASFCCRLTQRISLPLALRAREKMWARLVSKCSVGQKFLTVNPLFSRIYHENTHFFSLKISIVIKEQTLSSSYTNGYCTALFSVYFLIIPFEILVMTFCVISACFFLLFKFLCLFLLSKTVIFPSPTPVSFF